MDGVGWDGMGWGRTDGMQWVMYTYMMIDGMGGWLIPHHLLERHPGAGRGDKWVFVLGVTNRVCAD